MTWRDAMSYATRLARAERCRYRVAARRLAGFGERGWRYHVFPAREVR